jgi:hypothetical protein
LIILAAAAAYWLVHSRVVLTGGASAFSHPGYDVPERVMLLLIVFCALVFGVINACLPLGWDAFQVWATKGLVLYHQGALTPELWPPSPNTNITRFVQYPPMVSLFTALLALVRGVFSWTGTKPLFFAFYVSMLLSIFDAGRRLLTRRLALAAALISALVPFQFGVTAAGGYADMPLAAVLVAAIGAIFSAEKNRDILHSPLVWMWSGVLMVKNEGLLLFLIAGVVGTIALGRRVWSFWKPAVGLCVVLALRIAYVRWTNVVDIEYGYDLARAYHRLAQFPGAVGPWILRWDDWALFWPATLLACMILLVAGRTVERALAAGLSLGVAVYTGLYLFTNWDMVLATATSYSRTLQQLVPVGSLTLAAAYGCLTGTPHRDAGASAGRRDELVGMKPEDDTAALAANEAHTPSFTLSSRTLVVIGGIFTMGLLGLGVYAFRETTPRVLETPVAGSAASAKLTIPAGQAVVGYLDQVNGQPVIQGEQGGQIHVSGWAGCGNTASPLQRVEILVDNQVKATAALSVARPDVAAAFDRPDFEDSGWTASFEGKQFTLGIHAIIARAICAQGESGILPPFQLAITNH